MDKKLPKLCQHCQGKELINVLAKHSDFFRVTTLMILHIWITKEMDSIIHRGMANNILEIMYVLLFV